MKPFFDISPPAHSIGVSPDALWTDVSNRTFNTFPRTTADSMTDSTANATLLLGGIPAFRETTRPWMRARHMQNTNPTPASENEAESNIENTLALIEKAKSAVLEKLNKTRLAFLGLSNHLDRLSVEDDYKEGLLFLVKKDLMNGVMLSSIAPVFPDVAKLKAAREALRTAGRIKETKKGTAVVLNYVELSA